MAARNAKKRRKARQRRSADRREHDEQARIEQARIDLVRLDGDPSGVAPVDVDGGEDGVALSLAPAKAGFANWLIAIVVVALLVALVVWSLTR